MNKEIETQILDELNTEYEKAKTLWLIEKSDENLKRLVKAGYALRAYQPMRFD